MALYQSPLVVLLFWLLIGGVLVGAAWWMMRAGAKGAALENDRADLDVYADQVRELQRDLDQGRISDEAAQAGKLEIGRRIVRARDHALTSGPRASPKTIGLICAGVAVLAGGLYALSGSPGQADMPFQAREAELLARDPASLQPDEILLLLQERARQNPKDPLPHALMGQVLTSMGRDQDGLRAYQAVLRRAPNDSEALAEMGGILTRLSDGQINADARAAFDAALTLNKNSPAANFYLGLADWQGGQKDKALIRWANSFKAQGENAQGQAVLIGRVVKIMSELDIGPNVGKTGGMGGMGPMMAGTPKDRAAFISSMVGARQARLQDNPNDIALRLSVVRVLLMSGQAEAARQTLLEGVERAGEDPFVIALFAASAQSLPPPPRRSP
ncbi:MAG: hypothetical protein RLZZ157_582 [Pseudomonadota bacterium]|jgi:cytochrome c-type biogenesis protein CcmH